MLATRRERKEPVNLGLLGILLMPLMFIAAGLSIPYGLVAARVQRRRERAFVANMQTLGRIVEWPDFLRAIDETRGTVILERYSLKGPVRWWWTSENIYDVSPHLTADWLTLLKDESFRPFVEWCRQRYTAPDEGLALLVDRAAISERESHSFWTRLRSRESGDVRWIEVAPPKLSREAIRATPGGPTIVT